MEFIGEKVRMEAFEKLKVFIKNPGRFCLIVLGSRGSGKRFAIECAFSQNVSYASNPELCLGDLHFVESNDVPRDINGLDEFLKKNEYQTLVIQDVEDLDPEQEKLLFKVLSTNDGRFGIENKVKVRIVFTSSKDCDSLREDGKYLTGLFWDRISQLIVELPSYKEERKNVIKDFHFTWIKMKFENIEEYKPLSRLPKNSSLEKFLEDNAEKFEGGFRDLDKIACMYFNYRIYHYGKKRKIEDDIERKVVESVKSDFFTKSQMHGNSGNDNSIFKFELGLSHQELLWKYKIQLRRWAVGIHKSVGKAEEKLGFKPGSMKNYVEGRATKAEKKQLKNAPS